VSPRIVYTDQQLFENSCFLPTEDGSTWALEQFEGVSGRDLKVAVSAETKGSL
jgi:hypothetical protein